MTQKTFTIDEINAHRAVTDQIDEFIADVGRKVALILGAGGHYGDERTPQEIPANYRFNCFEVLSAEKIDEIDEYDCPTGRKVIATPESIQVSYYWSYNGGSDSLYVEFPSAWLDEPETIVTKAEAARDALNEKLAREEEARANAKRERERAEYERLKKVRE